MDSRGTTSKPACRRKQKQHSSKERIALSHFELEGALPIPLKESETISTKNPRPPDDFKSTMWSISICSSALHIWWAQQVRLRPCTRWLLILFEKSLGRLQTSHSGFFVKWLLGCSVDTASALACTVDSGNFGSGTSAELLL